MYTITKEFGFEAAHQLHGLPEGHQCARLHGHSYKVIVELQSEFVEGAGFVEDYGQLNDIKRYIRDNLDHRNLNDMMVQPTAENLARELFYIFRVWHMKLTAVTVKETEKTSATYRED